ncbi:MAG TPA: hypothetical protein VFX98_17100 [Longimicrobiaceae bacterium]|nr:hypothetical protein [Longimicrobiaceae bacterium]
MWGGLAAWALALGAFYVARPARAAPRPGERVLHAGLTGRSVSGAALALLPRDSVVAVLGATSECAACRVGIPAYREIAARLKEEGIALRVIVGSDSLAARQFSRLLPEPGAVVWDPRQKLFQRIGIRSVPSLLLVGRDGRLLKTWVPLSTDPRVAEEIAGAVAAER